MQILPSFPKAVVVSSCHCLNLNGFTLCFHSGITMSGRETNQKSGSANLPNGSLRIWSDMRSCWGPSAFSLPARSVLCFHVTSVMADGPQSTMNSTSTHGLGGFFNGQSFSFIRYGTITRVNKKCRTILPDWLTAWCYD